MYPLCLPLKIGGEQTMKVFFKHQNSNKCRIDLPPLQKGDKRGILVIAFKSLPKQH